SAGAGGGSGSGGGFNRAPTGSSSSASASFPDLSWVPGWLSDRVGLLVEIGVVVLAVLLVLFFLSCLAEGALVAAVGRIDAGEKVGFVAAWRAGAKTFWRVAGFKL